MNQPDLFGLNSIINKPRLHDGTFAPLKKDPQQLVKIHLQAGLSISVLDCLKLYHTTELRRIISRLRRTMTITDIWYIENAVKKYKLYRLKK